MSSASTQKTNIKMSRPTKSKVIKEALQEPTRKVSEKGDVEGITETPPPSFGHKALASTAHLANLLPTGTLLAFQLLTPVFTNKGSCDAFTRILTESLLLILAASSFLACFTDSFRSPSDGRLYYGFATRRGMRLFDYYSDKSDGLPDLAMYRVRPVDFVHAVASVMVFAAVALRDTNVVSCLYPKPERETKEVLDTVPLAMGLGCGLLFVVFPTRRHGIGYPVTTSGR